MSSLKLVWSGENKYWELEGVSIDYHLDQKNKEESKEENIKEKKVEKINYEEPPRTKEQKREDQLFHRDN